MKSKGWKKLTALLLCMTMLFGMAAVTEAAETGAQNVTVTIYTTNDIHGVVAGNEKGGNIGIAQAAAIAASTENALLVDAGDATQGASFATITQGADVIRLMNEAGYDAMAAGNHEFDYGTDRLLANQELAEFPILSANVKKDGKSLLKPYEVVEAGGKKIGFIGVTTKNTATSTNPEQLKGVVFEDEIQSVKDQLAAIRKESVDAVVLICHMGNSDAAVDCTVKDLLDGLSTDERAQIAAVVDGHSHTLESGDEIANIPVVQTGTQFTNLGVVTLEFSADGSVVSNGEVWDYAAAMAFPLNEAGESAKEKVSSLLAQIETEQKAVLGEKLCENETPLWGGYIYYDYVESRIVETAYGDFVTDAFVSYAEKFAKEQELTLPVIAVENGGGIGDTLPKGTVTRGDILNAFNHGNMVVVLQVTPQQLYTALELGLTMTGQDETGVW